MSEALRFERIAIRRMPGFDWEEGFEVSGLGPGVNILYGPNGSGKSTTASAIEHVLWPETAKGAHLQADMLLGERRVKASLEGPLEPKYEPEKPAACPIDGRSRYQFPLDQLLVDTGARFAEDLTSQMSGGYSIDAARRAIDKAGPLPGVAGLRGQLEKSREDYKRAEDRQSVIAAAEAELPSLEERLRDVERAQTRVEALSAVVDYRAAALDWLRAVCDLATLDPRSAKVRETDPESAVQRNEAVAAARKALCAAHKELSRHTPTGRWKRLPIPVPSGLHESLTKLCTDLKAMEAAIQGKRQEIARAQTTVEDSLRELSKYPDASDLSSDALLNADIEDLQSLALEEESARAKHVQFVRLREVLGVDGASIDDGRKQVADLSKACEKLSEWLREGTGVPPEELARRQRLSLYFVAFAAVGAVLGLVQPILGIAVAVLVAVVYGFVSRAAPPASEIRNRIRTSFPLNGVDGPSAWEPAQVQARIEALLDEIAKGKERQARLQRWEAARVDAEQAEKDWQRWDAERAARAEKYGVTFGSGAQSLAHLVAALNRALTAQMNLKGAQSELCQVLADREDRFAALADHLSRFGYESPVDLAEGERLCGCLAHWEKADVAWASAWAALKRARKERRKFYTDLELRVGDDETLRKWVDQAPRYQSAVTEAKARRATLNQARRKALGALPTDRPEDPAQPTLLPEAPAKLDPAMRRLKGHELAAQLCAARLQAEEAQDLRDRIRDCKKDADAARKGSDLGRALDSVHAAEAALIDHRQARKSQRIRQLVGDSVARELRASTVPEVFREARRLFMRVTNNEYALTFDPESNSFGAERSGRPVGLEGLSKGTRVQALLAVRLAWVVRQEAGPRLPILLDETLANCDETRANAIMDAVSELCADRQVFYFTAQADEVLRWKERLGEDRVTVIDLLSARKQSAAMLPPRRRVEYGDTIRFDVAGVPSPGDLDHEAYGRALDVVAIDPQRPIDALHIWHVLSDPVRVHELLSKGIVSWASLRQAVELRDPSPLTPIEWRLAQSRAAGIETACRCWMSDKAPNRIDPEALGDWLGKRVVREPVLQRAAECQWSGDALIESLCTARIASFGTARIDELGQWCVERGYAAAGDSVPYEDALLRVREALGRFAPGELPDREARTILARVGY